MPLHALENLTLHRQGPMELACANAAGFRLSPAPQSLFLPASGPENHPITVLVRLLEHYARIGHAVLVGGSCRLWIPAVLNCRQLPHLYAFRTGRLRDSRGRFRFLPVSLDPLHLHLPPSPQLCVNREESHRPHASRA